MTNKLLWSPSNTNTNLTKFKKKYFNKSEDSTYEQLHKWSVEKKEIFWDNVWDFTQIIGQKKEKVFKESKRFIDSKFFDQSTLNYAENCLKKNNNDDAIIFYNEKRYSKRIS